jgi:hypothetical protein
LPFKNSTFDIVFLRLAPLGPHGVPNAKAAFDLLKPGGWFFEAGWAPGKHETPPTEWAIQNGYASAEHHIWQYQHKVSKEEHAATLVEERFLLSVWEEGKSAEEAREIVTKMKIQPIGDGDVEKMTQENLLIAQKPM